MFAECWGHLDPSPPLAHTSARALPCILVVRAWSRFVPRMCMRPTVWPWCCRSGASWRMHVPCCPPSERRHPTHHVSSSTSPTPWYAAKQCVCPRVELLPSTLPPSHHRNVPSPCMCADHTLLLRSLNVHVHLCLCLYVSCVCSVIALKEYDGPTALSMYVCVFVCVMCVYCECVSYSTEPSLHVYAYAMCVCSVGACIDIMA